MKLMFFCYERDFAMRWCPAVYHDGEPKPKPRGESYTRSAVWAVPVDCIGADGEPLFGALQARFPAPRGEAA